MSRRSRWELLFEQQCQDAGLHPEVEYRFHPTRKWRFDFCWPDRLIAVEIEGATWSGGRHVRGKGFADDCEKYNAAAELGYRVFRYPSDDVKWGTAIQQIRRVLA